jgi:predicted RNA-binding Zn-ribbon protein involved in translation (DUF1610 family)
MAAGKISCPFCGTENVADSKFCYKCGRPVPAAVQAAPSVKTSDFITLSCPNCGGKLEVGLDMQRFTCKYCGLEHLVRHEGNSISLSPVVEGLKRVEGKFDQVLTGSDRMAAEQTIQRLKAEMPEYERRFAYWNTLMDCEPKKPISKAWIVICSILAIITGPFFILFTVMNIVVSYATVTVIFNILLGIFFISSIIVLIRGKQIKKKLEKLPLVQQQYQEAEAELRNRKDQLAQLHRYTAER